MWDEKTIQEKIAKQKAFFKTGATLDLKFRRAQLLKLKRAVIANQGKIEAALKEDLGRSEEEAYFCDVGTIILEVNEALRNLKRWAKPKTLYSGLVCFPSIFTKIYSLPYGNALIISPFNFPFLLSLGVLIYAIAGGNTAIIKASSKSASSTFALREIIAETFDEEYVLVIDGGHDIADMLLRSRFDKIFYTGSPKVGVHVMEEAAKNLTPVTLELGGENGNWAIVRKDADIQDAARKIAFFKICNSGQICINVNQVAIEREAAPAFLEALEKEIVRQIGEHPLRNDEYPHLIGKKAYQSCAEEAKLYQDRIVFGGQGDEESLRYEPTIIYPVKEDEPIVNHELFNPLLPIVPFDDVDELLNKIGEREHGLALYLFTKDKKWAKKVMRTQQYGGGCVNEVCLHMMVKGAPFGGTGHSGMGCYHGEWGYREFTHPSTVLFGKTKGNLPLREHPYTEKKRKLLSKFEK